MDLREIRKLVLSGKPLEEILEKIDWKEFEGMVSEIFERNGFTVNRNVRFKTRKRYEIDLVAVRGVVLCVDCKEWGRGRYKKAGLKHAAGKQEERTKKMKRFLKGNPIAQDKLKITPKDEFYTLIVTLLEEELIKEGNALIIPVWKLNSFLAELENYI